VASSASGGGERRSTARERRDRDHERETWARGLRYEAHLSFLTDINQMYTAASHALDRYDPRSLDGEEFVPLWDSLQRIRMICGERTAERTELTIKELETYAFRRGEEQAVEHAVDEYIRAIRQEFGLTPPDESRRGR
jgi:hypothetical protein